MIEQNLCRILERAANAAKRVGKDPALIKVTAMTKSATIAQTVALLRTGLVANIGENRVQDAAGKFAELKSYAPLPAFCRRLTGHLQRNKAAKALEIFDTIDSLDSLRLAQTLESHLSADKRVLPVLVQVKLSQRREQSGLAPEEVLPFLKALEAFKHLRVEGLMAIAPELNSGEELRPYFRRMKELFDVHFPSGGILSMGMSRDFEVAIEEGSTMIRIGTALFT